MSYKTLDENGEDANRSRLAMVDDETREKLLTGKVCGDCKYFSHREGQRLMEAQSFLARLVRENQWKVHHLGSPPETLGDCGAYRSGERGDETKLTGPMHVACDQFRRR